jgi:1-acyl-sn-glycerol-3-phosphate acyltransferase
MSDFQLKPADLPHWGQRTALRVLGLFGWRMLYRPLPGPRGIAVIYPHTSNWDFMVGLFGKWSLNLPFRWLAKDSLFKTPLGGWFRSLGGEPVDRSAPNGMIRSQAERMNAADWYWLAITPEATRGYRPSWKSGFYHLALEAKVPLALVYLDYPNKTLGLIDHLHLTGDQEADMAAIRAIYAGHHGLYPKNEAPIMLQERRTEARDEPAKK